MAQLVPLFLNTGSIEVVTGNKIIDFIHFPVTASNISSSYTTLLPDPYIFATMSADITNAANTTSSSLFQFVVPNRQENYFYPHNSIVGVSTSATATGVRVGLQSNASADAIANIKVASTLTAHTIANIGTQSPTTFALPGTMAAINTIYPSFIKGLYNNSLASAELKNTVLLQSETNNLVTARSGSVSYNKFVGYKAESRDRSFNIGSGFNLQVYTIDTQSDRKIVVGGSFTSYSGSTQNNITRLNSDGTIDSSFSIGSGFDGAVNEIAIQSDEKILVGGAFVSYNASSQNYITRLNSDGTIDSSFSIGSGFNNVVTSIAIQSDGKILVGGNFTTYDGISSLRAIRLNSDGTIDSSFNVGTGFSNSPLIIKIQQDEKILIGGSFTSYSGSTQNNITRLNSDGTIDSSFSIGSGFNNVVTSIAIQSDGKILVGGNFTTFVGSSQVRLIRLNSDGTKDTGFTVGSGFNGNVNSILIQKSGKIVIAGGFTLYNGVAQIYLTRVNTNGTRDSSYNISPNVSFGFSSFINFICNETNQKILVGGDFTSFSAIPQNRITRLLPELNTNTSIPLYLSTGSLKQISGSDTISSSYLPVTSSLWLSQSLATNIANTSATAYATVFTLTELTTNEKYLANLYMIGTSAAAATGFRMRVVTGSAYRGTLYTPTSTTAPAIQNSADGSDITSIIAATWPTINTKYLVFGEYTFIKGAQDPQVQILSETAGTAVTAFSGSVIFYRPID